MSDVIVPLKLAPHEINSPLWQKIDSHYRPKLAKYRSRIESTATPAEERQELAWKIDAIKKLLALAEPSREQEPDAD